MARPQKTLNEVLRDRTFRADRHGGKLANATRPVVAPKKPRGMTGPAGKLWDSIVADLAGTVSASDATALTALVRWWVEWLRIEVALRKSKVGAPTHGRLLRALAVANRGFAAFAAKFGLSPTDRERLPPPHGPDVGDGREYMTRKPTRLELSYDIDADMGEPDAS